jgi:hypothetical protein
MTATALACFDCDEPLSAEALEWHPARCPACALADYAREEEEADGGLAEPSPASPMASTTQVCLLRAS